LETRPRADAQPVKNWCDCRELHPDGGRAQALYLAGGSRKAGLLNHSREIKRAGSFTLPAHAISTKNKHLLVIYSIPTRGFTAAVSVFRGTPPPKPFDCKSGDQMRGVLVRDPWAEPTGGESRLSHARFRFGVCDII
jgi:hypothetical protein